MAGKIHAGPKRNFDPAAHLEKQGWKGKGTALKHGHAVRPLATVQKKTLSGIGKDRDLAVPFWDQIFASTAASLSLPGSDASSPAASPAPLIASSTAHQSTISWQTLRPHGSPVPPPAPPKSKTPGLSTHVRIGRETAKRGLYGRFYRGAVLKHEEVVEAEEEENVAGPSTPPVVDAQVDVEKGSIKAKKSRKDKEDKKDKRGKTREKEAKKEKQGKSRRREEDDPHEDHGSAPLKAKSSKKRRKDSEEKVPVTSEHEDPATEPDSKEERKAKRKEKKRLKAEAASS